MNGLLPNVYDLSFEEWKRDFFYVGKHFYTSTLAVQGRFFYTHPNNICTLFLLFIAWWTPVFGINTKHERFYFNNVIGQFLQTLSCGFVKKKLKIIFCPCSLGGRKVIYPGQHLAATGAVVGKYFARLDAQTGNKEGLDGLLDGKKSLWT